MAFVEPITIKEAVESVHKKRYLLDQTPTIVKIRLIIRSI